MIQTDQWVRASKKKKESGTGHIAEGGKAVVVVDVVVYRDHCLEPGQPFQLRWWKRGVPPQDYDVDWLVFCSHVSASTL
jgi:hypothetical protein